MATKEDIHAAFNLTKRVFELTGGIRRYILEVDPNAEPYRFHGYRRLAIGDWEYVAKDALFGEAVPPPELPPQESDPRTWDDFFGDGPVSPWGMCGPDSNRGSYPFTNWDLAILYRATEGQILLQEAHEAFDRCSRALTLAAVDKCRHGIALEYAGKILSRFYNVELDMRMNANADYNARMLSTQKGNDSSTEELLPPERPTLQEVFKRIETQIQELPTNTPRSTVTGLDFLEKKRFLERIGDPDKDLVHQMMWEANRAIADLGKEEEKDRFDESHYSLFKSPQEWQNELVMNSRTWTRRRGDPTFRWHPKSTDKSVSIHLDDLERLEGNRRK